MSRSFYTPPEKRLAEELKAQTKSLQDVQRPTGTEKEQTVARLIKTVDYLASLRYYAVNGGSWNTGIIPKDEVIRWSDGTVVQVANIDVPYRKMIVTASVGEASVTPGSGSGVAIEAFVSFWVLDVNGDPVGDYRSYYAGRMYQLTRSGLSLSTGPHVAYVNPVVNPGPYTVRLQFGYWSTVAGTGDPTIQFNSPSLTVQIIGDGVPD